VDLPGYGYAKVSRETKEQWQRDLSEYLQKRQKLRGLVLLMDIRHPLQEFDTTMLRWAAASQMPVHILLYKADKLSRSQAKNTQFKVIGQLKTLGLSDLVSLQCFSALSNTGIDELKEKLQTWLAPVEALPTTEENNKAP